MSDGEVVEIEPRAASPASDEQPTTAKRRSYLPRFGLRSLLIFAVVFCLFFAWIGRGLYRVRQEDAAIETLKRAEATIMVRTEAGIGIHPTLLRSSRWSQRADWDDLPSLPARATGLADPYPVFSVELKSEDPNDPRQKAALAALATFPAIEVVQLEGAAFDDESLALVAGLPKLSGLALSRTAATGAGLKVLPPLQSVQLSYQSVSRDDVETFAAMPDLRRLALTQVALDGSDVLLPSAVAESIHDLWLVHGAASRSLTEAEVQAFAALPNLRVLTLEGFDPALLDLLQSVESLRHLRLVGSAADRTYAKKFSEERPGCLVSFWNANDRFYFLDGESLDREAGFELSEKIQDR